MACIMNGRLALCRSTPTHLSLPSSLGSGREEMAYLPTRQTTAPRRGSGPWYFKRLRNVRTLNGGVKPEWNILRIWGGHSHKWHQAAHPPKGTFSCVVTSYEVTSIGV